MNIFIITRAQLQHDGSWSKFIHASYTNRDDALAESKRIRETNNSEAMNDIGWTARHPIGNSIGDVVVCYEGKRMEFYTIVTSELN